MAIVASGQSSTKVFFSYHGPDADVVRRVGLYLRNQSPLEAYQYSESQGPNTWTEQVGAAFDASATFVLFAGETFGDSQGREAAKAIQRRQSSALSPNQSGLNLLLVQLYDAIEWPTGENWVPEFKDIPPIVFQPTRLQASKVIHEGNAQRIAQEICSRLGMATKWRPDFEIPIGYPFEYEKKIIEEFTDGAGRLSDERVAQGCPEAWPVVEKRPAESRNNVPQDLIGRFSREDDRIVVDARWRLVQAGAGHGEGAALTFAEARPRERLRLPRLERLHQTLGTFNVGILVSGGIAPGINAVISGIVERHLLYARYGTETARGMVLYTPIIWGYLNGFRSLEFMGLPDAIRLDDETWKRKVRDEANRGGSLLGTSRLDALLVAEDPSERRRSFDAMLDNLRAMAIDVLYVIGGDGSMRAAHGLQVAARVRGDELTVVGIPKTMDNDVLWVWQSFGFMSAVEKAKEFIIQLHTEAESNPRLCVVQLFGSDSGFVVSHAAVASGVVDLALIPEIPFSMSKVADYIKSRLTRAGAVGAGNRPHGLVLMAETAIPTDVDDYIRQDDELPDDQKVLRLEPQERKEIDRYVQNGRRVRGQTPDALRTGGLKIVSRVLQDEIKKIPGDHWSRYRVFTNEPRHLLRSVEPSSADIVFGHRLGCLAVDNAMAGFRDFMISQWLTEFVLVPLRLVVLGRKRVPREGIFWRSVLDSTGQPSPLTDE